MEPRSLWPGRAVDWARRLIVVHLSSSRRLSLDLTRVKQATQARERWSPECAVVCFADTGGQQLLTVRRHFITHFGDIAAELGCQHLVLAAYSAERLELDDLMGIVDAVSDRARMHLEIEIYFRRAAQVSTLARRGHVGDPFS